MRVGGKKSAFVV